MKGQILREYQKQLLFTCNDQESRIYPFLLIIPGQALGAPHVGRYRDSPSECVDDYPSILWVYFLSFYVHLQLICITRRQLQVNLTSPGRICQACPFGVGRITIIQPLYMIPHSGKHVYRISKGGKVHQTRKHIISVSPSATESRDKEGGRTMLHR